MRETNLVIVTLNKGDSGGPLVGRASRYGYQDRAVMVGVLSRGSGPCTSRDIKAVRRDREALLRLIDFESDRTFICGKSANASSLTRRRKIPGIVEGPTLLDYPTLMWYSRVSHGEIQRWIADTVVVNCEKHRVVSLYTAEFEILQDGRCSTAPEIAAPPLCYYAYSFLLTNMGKS